jgi:hypothetical protein
MELNPQLKFQFIVIVTAVIFFGHYMDAIQKPLRLKPVAPVSWMMD